LWRALARRRLEGDVSLSTKRDAVEGCLRHNRFGLDDMSEYWQSGITVIIFEIGLLQCSLLASARTPFKSSRVFFWRFG